MWTFQNQLENYFFRQVKIAIMDSFLQASLNPMNKVQQFLHVKSYMDYLIIT